MCENHNKKHDCCNNNQNEKIKHQYCNEECCCDCPHDEHEHHHDEECCCQHHKHNKKNQIILLIRVFVSIVLFVLAFVIKNNISNIILLSISYLIIAYDILLSALKNIINGKLFDENFLMTLASLTAIIVAFVNPNANIDAYDGVLVILLYQVGEYLQHLAVDRSKQSITDMMALDINHVTLIENGLEKAIETSDIKIDDILLIKPGETIPTDGIIINGNSSLNTSSLTGESKPLDVSVDDKVLSGCINNDGLIQIKATTTYNNSTTAKVIQLINQASKNKANSERFITKFAKIYTPIVIFISLFVMFIIPLFLGFQENFMEFLYKGLTIMVISCPCALVISIPLSFFMGIGKSAANGILVKGASYLEVLSNVKTIAFDKTGTLTTGTFVVSTIISNEKELMSNLLYSIEKNFTHPIAVSIMDYFKNEVNEIKIENIKNIPGYGISAQYNCKEVLIGNEKLLKKHNISIIENNEISTILYVSYDNKCIGYVVLEDRIKNDSLKSIAKLKKLYHVVMISGDNKFIVEKVAKNINIGDYYYETLPEDKVIIINKYQKNGQVAYVGDGINDAACLINAACGIAMKSLGSDIAIEASDVVIMDDNIASINNAIAISKKTMRIVIENIVLSLLIKVSVMAITMFVNIPMFIAIIADVGVCLLAILNSLRIMYGKLSNKIV